MLKNPLFILFPADGYTGSTNHGNNVRLLVGDSVRSVCTVPAKDRLPLST